MREIPKKYPKKIPEVVLNVNPNKPIVPCWSSINLRETYTINAKVIIIALFMRKILWLIGVINHKIMVFMTKKRKMSLPTPGPISLILNI